MEHVFFSSSSFDRFGGASYNQGKKRPDLTPTEMKKILCPQDEKEGAEEKYWLPQTEMIDNRRRVAKFVG